MTFETGILLMREIHLALGLDCSLSISQKTAVITVPSGISHGAAEALKEKAKEYRCRCTFQNRGFRDSRWQVV